MSEIIARGAIAKMRTELTTPVQYRLPIGDTDVAMNPLIGQRLRLEFLQEISCCHCGRKTNKSFNQGYCYPCFTKLAQCDNCIVSPEKCHYDAGTCREPEWGETHCMIDHYVYLANSSGLKVGITRGTQIPTRWMDQGATQAIPLLRVSTRRQSGLVEVACKAFVADKTNWRTMLKGDAEHIDMAAAAADILSKASNQIASLQGEHGLNNIQVLEQAAPVSIDYPVEEYPTKVSSFNLDKEPVIEAVLKGIKGQYLIFDSGVINMRKYTAYHLQLSVLS
ncbi:MAG TPA: DUF2797 domain-containing protein [Pseudomonadales bacterium]|nr:DUF2797 domain-containing protein [Pseudomonadales bacterium]